MPFLTRLWNTLRPRALRRELDEELRLHMDLRARDLEKTGLSPGEARRQAQRQFGNPTLEKERMRDMDITRWMETLFKDVRYALRQFARNPAFTAVAVISLALGIGANTAIFSVLNAALLKSLPVTQPHELVMLTDPESTGGGFGLETGSRSLLSYAEYEKLRDGTTTLSGLCASEAQNRHLSVRIAGGQPEDARGYLVSENYFAVLGVPAAIGRLFSKEDAAGGLGTDPYVVLSHDFWQRRFKGNPSVLGTNIQLYRASYTVIGVATPGFRGETVGESPDLWFPMMMQLQAIPGRDLIHEDLSQTIGKAMWLHAIGRLKPGVTKANVQAEVKVQFRRIIEASYPSTLRPETRKNVLNQFITVRDASTGVLDGRTDFSHQLFLLLSVSGLVLLIACANVANLLLARATARSKEVGVRISIGAGKARLVRQFLTESLLLSILGGIAGVLVAFGATQVLLTLFSQSEDPLTLATGFDFRMLAFTIGVTLATALLFGLAPALRATRVDVGESLKETGRGVTTGSRRLTVTKTLVIAQMALCLLLVIAAGLFLRTLWNLQNVSLGYAKDDLLQFRINGQSAGYKGTRLLDLYRQVAASVQTIAGVRDVTYSSSGVLTDTDSGDSVEVEGFKPGGPDDSGSRFDRIGHRYFATTGIPLLRGREFNDPDFASSQKVCIVNEAFVKKYFHGGDPIGKIVTQHFGDSKTAMQVIGVSGNAHDHGLREAVPPRFYVPMEQTEKDIPGVYFQVRTTGDPRRLPEMIRKTVVAIDAELQPRDIKSIDEALDERNARPRMIARLCTIFGGIALLLAATGLYGVLSYGIARRTNEIGIRMALGAGKSRVIGMILRETGFMVVLGIVAGVAAAALATRWIASQLFGLEPMDPFTIGIAVIVLTLVAAVAGYIPAAKAARVSPIAALRHD